VILADGPDAPHSQAPRAVSDEEPRGDHDSGAWMVLTQLSTRDADRAVREAASRARDGRSPGPVHPGPGSARSSCESMRCRSDLRPHRPRR